jgi:hypothetical protein
MIERMLMPPQVLGHRGAHLLPMSAILLSIALMITLDPPTPGRGGDLFTYLPLAAHVALWAVAGAIAAGSAFLHTPGADTLGFTLVVCLATFRAFAYAWAWLDSLLPGVGGHGDPLGWFGAVCFAVIALTTMNVAGWQEDPRRLGRRS